MNIVITIYGLLRMVLGIAQLVGMTAGFFITEWIIRYPKGSFSFIFDQDILAIVYLAVFLRAIFHLVSGIGIARSSEWVTGWLMYGWPIVLIIVGGLLYTQSTHWADLKLVRSVWDVISWPKLIIYLVWVIFDYIIAILYIDKVNQSVHKYEQEVLDGKKLGMIFFASTAFFVILLYVGKPIKQGFHKGYYRINDSTAEDVDTKKLEKDLEEIKKALQNQKKKEELVEEEKEMVREEDASEKAEEKKEEAKIPAEPNNPEAISYRAATGYLGGLGVIVGLFLQLLCIYKRLDLKEYLYAFLLQSVGFFLLLFYAFSNKINPVAFMAFFAFSLSVAIVVILWSIKRK